jgi:uncharacterized membrane protein
MEVVDISLRGNIILVNAAVLFFMLVTALTNSWQAFGYLTGLSLSLWLITGAMRENKLGPAVWIGVSVFVIWSVCITLIFKYWAEFRGQFPEFTIAGMHPGFFILFPVMWLLIFIPGTLSYALLFDRWIMTEDDWKEFCRKTDKEGEL